MPPTSDFASVTPQFPLNAGGVFGPNGILSYGRFYTATGGSVGVGQIMQNSASPTGPIGPTGIKNAGPAGWPGIGATLVGTGRYNVMHPPATIVSLNPTVAAPSGIILQANQVRDIATGFIGDASLPGRPAATGITQIQVFGTTGGSASGAMQLVNPPTGVRFDLWLYTAPNNTAGFTQF